MIQDSNHKSNDKRKLAKKVATNT